MGNTCSCSCIENYNYEKLLKRRCPYCNFTLKSVKEKNKHIKNCVYNQSDNSIYNQSDHTIYSDDPFKL